MKALFSFIFLTCIALTGNAADWYLYIWSDTNNSGYEAGQFQPTTTNGMYVLEGLQTAESGLKFCIHDAAWATIYGWSTGSEGSVSYTDTEVSLGTTTSANGYLGLSAGTYDVTFNALKPSVQFNTPVPAVGTGTKKVSILGDSYSTYYGYLRPYTNKSWYSIYTTQYYSDNDVTTLEQTWWYKLITGGDYVLERNNSYSGATMVNGCLADMDVSTSFISRATELGNPDIILVFGGTNDWWNGNSFSLGDYKYSSWSDTEKAQFRPGTAYLLNLLKTTYPNAEIRFILNDLITDEAGGNSSTWGVRTSIKTICAQYDIPVIELTDIAKGSYHPTEAGMTAIASQVKAALEGTSASDEGNYWYLTGAFNDWGYTNAFTQSAADPNVFTLNIEPTSAWFDDHGGLSFNIVTPSWAQNYVCNSTISTLGTAHSFTLKASDDDWASAYCNAMSTGHAYTLTWNKSTHQLTIADAGQTSDSAITYTTYPDGHALATVDDYLRGGDISMLNYVEDLGAKFYDTDGTQMDALDIMQRHGVNFVRLRLYNNPGASVSYGSSSYSKQTYALPAGYLGEDDVLKLARRAKERGMKIELTFHYSDFWTNGEMQIKPKGWENYTFAELQTAVYNYTYNFLQRMNQQGTTPDYVSLGNEIQSGLLFGYYTSDMQQVDNVNGYAGNMSNVAALLSNGSIAVRKACPNAKVIIHLTMSQSVTESNYIWFFDEMKKYNLDYDIIGASYYPYWTEQKPSMLDSFATKLYNRYGKNLMIMEVGYSWTQYRPSERYYGYNSEGQLHMNGSVYNEASEAGQKAFMQEVQQVVKGNDHILGYLYWDPVMVEQKVGGSWIKTGWVAGGDNQVGNTTWFDYNGKALPVFEAIAEDMHTVPQTVTVDGTTYEVETQPPFTVVIPSMGYSTFFDSWVRTVPRGLRAYTAVSTTGSKMRLKAIDNGDIPANTGVVLKGSEGTHYLWTGSNPVTIGTNLLTGTNIDIDRPEGSVLTLAQEGGKMGFYNFVGTTIPAHKAYLILANGVRSFSFDFDDETTDIGLTASNDATTAPANIYDMQGRMVRDASANSFSSLRKGVYIRGGRKIVIR